MRAVNLIPADQRGGAPVGAGRSEGAAYAVLAVIAGFAIMAVLYGKAHHKVESSRSQAAALTAKAQQEQNAASALAPYATFISLRQQRTQAVEQLVDTRFDWAHAFHEFGRVLPSDVAITSIDGTVGSSTGSASSSSSSSSSGAASAAATPVTSATPEGSVPTFTLSGCAASQTVVAEAIDRLRLIDGVAAVSLQSSTSSPSNGGSGGSGTCTSSAPVFTILVTFQPLPSPAASTVAPSTSSKAAGSSSSSSTGTGGSLR